MRICILSDYYYPQLGGITEHVHGQAVNLASRLCDNAGSDHIVADVRELHLPTWVVAVDRVHVPVKGFSEPIEAVVLAPEESILHEYRQPGVLVSLVDGLTKTLRPRKD